MEGGSLDRHTLGHRPRLGSRHQPAQHCSLPAPHGTVLPRLSNPRYTLDTLLSPYLLLWHSSALLAPFAGGSAAAPKTAL
eukprot:4143906-Prymnesium_polylepis.1